MAKTSMKEREKRRSSLHKTHGKKRKTLSEIVCNMQLSDEERMNAVHQLQKLPRDSSRSRQRNRCRQCGRSRAYNRLTGLCRIHMRSAVMNGLVPGMHKASW